MKQLGKALALEVVLFTWPGPGFPEHRGEAVPSSSRQRVGNLKARQPHAEKLIVGSERVLIVPAIPGNDGVQCQFSFCTRGHSLREGRSRRGCSERPAKSRRKWRRYSMPILLLAAIEATIPKGRACPIIVVSGEASPGAGAVFQWVVVSISSAALRCRRQRRGHPNKRGSRPSELALLDSCNDKRWPENWPRHR